MSSRTPSARTLRTLAWRARQRLALGLKRLDRTPLYCKALAGESDYNICINSDLTVSCNCQDYNGEGIIGDLQEESLLDIFSGRRVQEFQASLASCDFPTSVCPVCPEVAPIPRDRRSNGPVPGKVPRKGIMVENTAACNLRCTACRRDELLANRRRLSMEIDHVKMVSEVLAHHEIEQVFYFSLGEPFLSPRVLDEVRIVRKDSPHIRMVTSTNGVPLEGEDKIEAALMMDHIYFSIAGVSQDMLVRHQRGGRFERQFQNLCSLTRAKRQRLESDSRARVPLIDWKYVYFRWNDGDVELLSAIELAREAGADRILFHIGGVENPEDRSRRPLSDSFFARMGATPVDDGVGIELA